MNTEADRKDFWESQKNINHKKAIAKWLSENPSIGVLNGGKYYKVVEGQMVNVKEFEAA
jgi:hypothetical protein